ncbi:hypothetical protein [Actinomadura sp. NPDC049753]|uniref:hypothetical protein n=1 Tax=Actinomadura sp. NPDC049753 TaxID=3154739 RepID=UPI003449DE4B
MAHNANAADGWSRPPEASALVAPEESERRRLALGADRRNRLDLIARTTERLMARMDAAAGTVGGKVQIHPAKAQAVVQSNDHISIAIVDFHELLGIERGREDDERTEED